MATHSMIGIIRKNCIEVTYCHYDGFLEGNGKILNTYYQNIKDTEELISRGAIYELGTEIKKWLQDSGISFSGKVTSTSVQRINGEKILTAPKNTVIFEHKSPTLDKIVYWFMRKSVNLYGETFIKL